ncbi:MAG: hypothetical protein Q9175_005829 [Cornicularia normoerica]
MQLQGLYAKKQVDDSSKDFDRDTPSTQEPSRRAEKKCTIITGMTKNTPKTKNPLIGASWCGSTNIRQCCIECLEEWDRRESAQREEERMRKMQKKARDASKGNFTTAGEHVEVVTRPGNLRQTQKPKPSIVQKPGKWPMRQRQQIMATQVAPELEQAPEEDEEPSKGKGKTQGLTLYRAKKKWRD